MRAVTDPPYRLLTATETAAVLRVPLPTLVDWQNFPGTGPDHLFIDGRMMFRLDTIHAWIDRLSAAGGAAPDAGEQLEHEVEFGRVS